MSLEQWDGGQKEGKGAETILGQPGGRKESEKKGFVTQDFEIIPRDVGSWSHLIGMNFHCIQYFLRCSLPAQGLSYISTGGKPSAIIPGATVSFPK